MYLHYLRKVLWRIRKSRPVQFFGEIIIWFDTARFLEVNLDTRLISSPHIYNLRKKSAQRVGVLGPNKRSGLSVRNGVLL